MKSILPSTSGLAHWNAITGVVVLATQTATFLLLSPLVLHNLGPEAFGIWSLGSTILAFATLLDLGIGEAAAQRVGELGGARASPLDVARIASEAAYHYRRMTAIGFAVAPIVAIGLVAAIQFQTLPAAVVFGYFLCACAGFFVGLPSYARAAILVGRGETWAQRVPLLAESIVTFVVSLVALSSGLGLLALGAAIIVSRAAGAIVRRWVYNRIIRPPDLRQPPIETGEVSTPFISIRGAALPFLLIAIAARFEISVGPLVLATRVGVDEVGPYLFAFRCFFTLLQVTWQLTDQLFPAYRRLIVEQGWSAAARLTEQSLGVTLPFVAVASCLGAFAYDGVVGAIAPGLAVGPAVTTLLALFAIVYHTAHVLVMGANGGGLQLRVMPVIIAGAATGFGVGFLLADRFGSAGIVAGLIVANAVVSVPGLAHIWSTTTSHATWRWLAPVSAPAFFLVATLAVSQLLHIPDEAAAITLAVVAGVAIAWNVIVIARRWPEFRAAVRGALGIVRRSSPEVPVIS